MLTIDMAWQHFALAVLQVLAHRGLDRRVRNRPLDFDLHRQFMCHVFELFVSRSNDPLAIHREVLTTHLAAEKVKADVADDFVEEPATAVALL